MAAAAGSSDSETTTHNVKVDGAEVGEVEREEGERGRDMRPFLSSFSSPQDAKTAFIEVGEGAALRVGGGVPQEVLE